MNRIFILLLMCATLLLPTPAAWAQNTPPTTAPNAFVTIDLAAGFPLDPLIVSLNGGGAVDAGTFGETCVGFVAENPTVTVNWVGDTDFVEAFFYSDHDPVLVVETPAGDYLCNDDANNLLLDPVIELRDPAHGRYNIWVGSHAPGQLLPGVLVLTTRPEVNLGTFVLDDLITRASIPEDLVEAHEVNTGTLITQTAASEAATAVDWRGEEELTHTVTVSGTVPAFDLSTPGVMCNGFIHASPDFTFSLNEAPDQLQIFFEGDGDATLTVQDPTGAIFCNDDHVAGANLNPVVDIPAPTMGQYYVFIGRVQLAEEVNGLLTVSGSVAVNPAVLPGEE